MTEVWKVIIEALIDTAKILPFLFIVYYLIELFEFKFARKFQNNKLLKGNLSPLFGSFVGCVPQCGFSVVSADLFTKRAISVGALVAVLIATSDEALPLMIANPSSIKWLLLLIAVKILVAIVVGYLAIALYKLIFKKQKTYIDTNTKQDAHNYKHENNEHETHEHNHDHEHELLDREREGETSEISTHGGCCHHSVETKSFDWLHPLLHCLKIAVFVLVINLIFGFITQIWVGEDNLTKFLSNSLYIQPILAVMIGFIPNCASSVVLTELFLMGGLSFGSLVAGLCVNAGLGVIILLKQNKNVKENLFVLAMLIIPSLLIGYALNFI